MSEYVDTPVVGREYLISRPKSNDAAGNNRFNIMTVLWFDDNFILYGRSGSWPLIYKRDDLLIKKIPKKEIRVKKASEVIKWLEDNGYILNDIGEYIRPEAYSGYVVAWLLPCCGKKYQGTTKFPSDWLEEVEV